MCMYNTYVHVYILLILLYTYVYVCYNAGVMFVFQLLSPHLSVLPIEILLLRLFEL